MIVQAPDGKFPVRGMLRQELVEVLAGLGETEDRVRRLQTHVFKHRMDSFIGMEDISARSKDRMARVLDLDLPAVDARAMAEDGTRKYRVKFRDGSLIECISMAYNGRRTLCLSTQAGCRMGCTFCATGAMGFARNLTAAEIVDQALVMLRDQPADRFNVVLMGMGEPLNNPEQLARALTILVSPWGMDRGPRTVTVSTIGLLPALDELAALRLGVNLSLSVTAAREDLRQMLMPATRAWPLAQVFESIRRYPPEAFRSYIYSYVMFAGVNDQLTHARELAAALDGLPGYVNLIPMNPTPASQYLPSSDETVSAFRNELFRLGRAAHPRYSKGRTIWAACGQLAGAALPMDTTTGAADGDAEAEVGASDS